MHTQPFKRNTRRTVNAPIETAFHESKTEITSQNRQASGMQKTIPAIPVIVRKDGRAELGAITHLSADAHIEYVGEGFNEHTARVDSQRQSYVVFREDLRNVRCLASESPIAQQSNGGPNGAQTFLPVGLEVFVDPKEGILKKLSRMTLDKEKQSRWAAKRG